MTDTTDNAFLGGRLQILQPRQGYRAGIDPVILAAACHPKRGGRVLELGCGVGTALLCLGARRPDLSLTGVEILPLHVDLARENLGRNGMEGRIVQGDIADLPKALRAESFDLVLANPPFFDRATSTASDNTSKESGRGGQDLGLWVETAARRLAPRGLAVFLQHVSRMPDLLLACQGRLGSVEVIPISGRQGRDAGLVILRATKGGRAAFRLAPQVVLHRGATHACDGGEYSPDIEAVLRNGAALPVT